MRPRTKIIIFFVAIFLFPSILSAADKKIIFSPSYLTSQEYQSAGIFWQIYNNSDDGLYPKDDGLLLKNDGDAYLVYPASFSYHDYDRINLVFHSNKSVKLTLLPNVSSTGYNTYELTKDLPATELYQTISLSLRLPFFKESLDDLGINFKTNGDSEIVIKEISLEKMTAGWLLVQAVKDYFKVSPYSSFTVNLFPTPRIFGYSALVYFLPLIFVLLLLLFYSKKWRKLSLAAIFVLWVLIDFRMGYEFLNHHLADYQSFVQPEVQEKVLRNYGDFYQFADWVKSNLRSDYKEINFYSFGSVHFPRLLEYLVYPVTVYNEEKKSDVYLIYNRPDISYNQSDQRLYRQDDPITDAGEILAFYNDHSFIFQNQ